MKYEAPHSIRDPRTGSVTNVIIFETDDDTHSYSQEYFAVHSEHVTLRTAPNGKVFTRDELANLVRVIGPLCEVA